MLQSANGAVHFWPMSDSEPPLDEFALGLAIAEAGASTRTPHKRRCLEKAWVARSRQASSQRLAKFQDEVRMRASRADDAAVHECDIIALDRSKPVRGASKRWTPRAMLKVSFGKPRKNTKPRVARPRFQRRRVGSVVVASARSTADNAGGNHTHVQKIRDSISHRLTSSTREAIDAEVRRGCFCIILDLRFDETQHEFRQQGDDGTFPLVMIKASITWCPNEDSAPICQEIYVSPAALVECCSAEALWAVLRQKLPYDWDDLASHADIMAVILCHDSHSGNLRLFRGIVEAAPANVWVISSRCCMHQLQRILCGTYRMRCLSFHNPLFSLCKLLHNGVYMKALRKAMHEIIDRRFKVVYRPVNAAHVEWSRRFLEVMYVHDGIEDMDAPASDDSDTPADTLVQSTSALRREEARTFVDFFNYNLQERDVILVLLI